MANQHTFTTAEGLTQNSIRSIIQDSDGFLWFGTKNGLNRFDGLEIKNFHHNTQNSSTLSSNHVTALALDSDDNLWVVTNNGLNLWDEKLKQFTRFVHPKSTNITDITLSLNSQFWLSTSDSGIITFDTKFKQYSTPHSHPALLNAIDGKHLTQLAFDHSNNLWLGTRSHGFMKYNLFTQQLFIFDNSGITSTYYSDRNIINITVDSTGGIWIL